MAKAKTPKDKLLAALETAQKNHKRFIAVQVVLPDTPLPELIINHIGSANAKLAYYKAAYDDLLCLKANNAVRITAFAIADTPNELFSELSVDWQ
jgi:hypothetical protein